jgi:hypothetical protein
MGKRKRQEFTPAEKLRYISMAIEEVVKMRKFANKNWKPRTSLIGLTCQYTSQPKLKPEDFESMLDMTLREIILSEVDFPLTTEELKAQKK